jgi:hypothetical protein
VVSLGAHIAEKGHLDVIEAVRSLSPQVQEQVFLLIGGPPLAGDYHDEDGAAGSEGTAPGVGARLGRQGGRVAAGADIYAWRPSRGDAAHSGRGDATARHRVGYPVGGVPELIHDGQTGLIAAPRRPDDLAAKIAALVSDRALADQLAARAEQFVLENNSDASMRENSNGSRPSASGPPPTDQAEHDADTRAGSPFARVRECSEPGGDRGSPVAAPPPWPLGSPTPGWGSAVKDAST